MEFEKCKLRDIADVMISGVDKKSNNDETPVRLCNFVDVYRNWAITSSLHDTFMQATAKQIEIDRFLLHKGQVAITKDSETRNDIGIATYIADDFDDVILGYHCALITPNNELVDSKYLNAFLHSNYILRYFELNATGSGMRYTLSNDTILNMPILLPSIEQQKAIGRVFSNIDKQIETLNSINRNLEQSVEHAYQFMFFSKQRPRLSLKSMESIATIKAGGDCPTKYSRSKTSQYQIPIYSNSIDKDGLYGFAEKAIILEPGITIAARGTIGFCALRTKPYVPIIRLLSVSPHDRGGDIYLYQFFKKVVFEKNGSVQQQLTVPMLSCITIPYPSKEELNKFDKIVRPFIIMQSCNKENIEALQKLRDELLPLLLNGQVQVNCDLSQ